jgi:hypothetical protein
MIYGLMEHGLDRYQYFTLSTHKMRYFFPLISLFLGQWIHKFQKITCLNY